MCSEMGRRVDERHLILAFINSLFATDLLYTQIFRVKDTIIMSELREFQEEYIALEEKQRDMESYPVAISDSKGGNTSLLPRLTNAVASTSQRYQGKSNAVMEQKLVAMGNADQAEFEKEYKDKQLQKYGSNDTVQPGEEPPPRRMSKEFCVYHRFHGHTTSNCRNVRKIILRIIEQGKLDHFLLNETGNLPPPPPQGNKYGKETDRNTFVIEDWQKQKISFSANEVPEGKDSHECPLVVRLVINPKPLEEDEEENEKNTWPINRILIDTRSSVDILFYHTYKTVGGRDDELIPSTYKIYGFNGFANKPKREVTMRILLQSLPTDITFCVVDVESPYNALIGRPWMHSILAVASTFHQCIKFHLPKGVGIIRGDTVESKSCQEIDIDRCEARESKRRNWQKNAAYSKRAERLMVDV
ncbi:uncharacterized protein LOC113311414 [Papaver somniferum]|uniref:uncharacterized protein LOC113311414 n=1 Tax=Papaver somniferum TaxID=3469 RepID=UPI000E6F797A|nr:uncharacterized protein LOC113311414 [Papaver somniferum]